MDGATANELDRAAKAIADAPELALACHITPDGDALGSMLALLDLARASGKVVAASWPAPFVHGIHYRSLPGLDLAVAPAAFPADPELMLTFDCGSLRRLHELGDAARWARDHGELVVIDHHASNDRYGTINAITSTPPPPRSSCASWLLASDGC